MNNSQGPISVDFAATYSFKSAIYIFFKLVQNRKLMPPEREEDDRFPFIYTLSRAVQSSYLQPIITQYFIDNKSEIWLLFLIAHSKR